MAKKALVAYFSASGVTAALAKRLADVTHADLHEIQPEVPYTKEDLDWTNKNSRSSVEMNDKSFRPPVANRVENIDDYDTIYVGFPIWWYVAQPSLIHFWRNMTCRERRLFRLQPPAAVVWDEQMKN